MEEKEKVCINDVLTDDGLRAILAKLEEVSESQKDKDNYGLVCKRWLRVQSTERRRLRARAGPLMLQRLAARFTRLIDLDFSQSVSRSFFPGVSDKDLEIIGTKFQCLQSLNLRECKGITDAGLKALGKGLRNLHLLDISQCRKITDSGIQALAEGCPTLVTLRINGCKFVSDGSLQTLSRNCIKLEELELQGCTNITDGGLSALAQGCLSIQILDISKCVKVGDNGVMRLAEACSLLKILKLSDCSKISSKTVVCLAEGSKRLEVLMVGGCRLVSDESIQALAFGCSSSLINLQVEWCVNLSDESIISVLSQCLRLENLNIACCDKITDHAFSCLRNGGSGSLLKLLKINNCPGISVTGIALLAEFCPSLEFLDVRSCPQITEEDVNRAGINFAKHCKLIYQGTISEHAL
uniref:F-box/LRR-repeat protein 15-like leucin rich repeat domain-containing protein n=1 Tax=Araucaria cunninghamii TaxID=56994 RepID=A0A0D6R2A9_ARACU